MPPDGIVVLIKRGRDQSSLFLSFFLSLEDIARRQPSANQEEGHGQMPNLPAL